MTKFQHFYPLFKPEHYDIYLDIDREAKQFSGKTTITGTATTEKIGIHQKDLEVSEVLANGDLVPYTIDKELDAIWIDLPKSGQTTLDITYSAKLTDTMMGIYPSYYEVDGVKKQLIGTQFETNSARQAFPSIDEPVAKATFSLAIKFDEKAGETIISNMPEEKVVDGVHYFEKTVPMSTYLVAFGFGEMISKTTTTKSGVKVGIFATKAHQAKELDFGLDIAKRSIEFYEDFFQTPYPLPHSWQLGLPDLSAGAMENWGLITYREAFLLVDPDNTSLRMQQIIATVIAHEVAHQWFGDLVTMKWWDDLWLNESFANMMEYVAVDAIEPDWNVWEIFQTSDTPAALERDATDGVQSVYSKVEDPAEVDSLFDSAIVYAKGARMLVMVRALIGDEALRTGLKAYFDKHQYNNTVGADLWSALSDASGIDVGAVMKSWLEQPGYPVVSAKVVDGRLVLSQQQFFIGDGKDVGRLWQVPLNSNYAAVPDLMTDKELVIGDYDTLREKEGTAFRLNVGNSSHFIVSYEQALLDDILTEADQLDAISKLQLLQDLRLLAEGRRISYASLIPLLSQFSDSHSAIVNTALYDIADNLKRFVTPKSEEETTLKAFFHQLSATDYDRLGLEPKTGEPNDDQVTRQEVISAATYADNQAFIADAHRLFEAHTDHLATISASVRPYVLINEVKHFGSKELIDTLLDEYRRSTDASYKASLSAAIARTENPEEITKIVTLFKDADTIKPQDLRSWFYYILANDQGQQVAWDWIKSNWQWLLDTVGGDMSFTSYITVISRVFKTPERLAEFKAFFEPKLQTPGLTREITMGIKSIESRVALIADEKDAVNQAVAKAINK